MDNESIRILIWCPDTSCVTRYRSMFDLDNVEQRYCKDGESAREEISRAVDLKAPYAAFLIDLPLSFRLSEYWMVIQNIQAVDEGVKIILITENVEDLSQEKPFSVRSPDRLLFFRAPLTRVQALQLINIIAGSWRTNQRIRTIESELADTSAACVDLRRALKSKETALQWSQNLFFSFMRHLPALACLKDVNGKYIYLNEAYKKLLKSDTNRLIGKTDRDIWPRDIADRIMATDQVAIGSGKVLQTAEILSIRGKSLTFQTKKFPIQQPDKPLLLATISSGGNFFTDGINDWDDIMEDESEEMEKSNSRDVDQDGMISAFDESQGKDRPPERLPGLDISEGMDRLGGSFDLYLDLLMFFCEDKKDFYRDFTKMIGRNDYENAAIEAHSLKGSAGTISANELKNAAKSLEDACKERDKQMIQTALNSVKDAFEQVLLSSVRLGEKDPGCQSPTLREPDDSNIEHEKLMEACRRLKQALDNADPILSEQCLKQIKSSIDGFKIDPKLQQLFQDLDRQTAGYHFENAADTLQKLFTCFKKVKRK